MSSLRSSRFRSLEILEDRLNLSLLGLSVSLSVDVPAVVSGPTPNANAYAHANSHAAFQSEQSLLSLNVGGGLVSVSSSVFHSPGGSSVLEIDITLYSSTGTGGNGGNSGNGGSGGSVGGDIGGTIGGETPSPETPPVKPPVTPPGNVPPSTPPVSHPSNPPTGSTPTPVYPVSSPTPREGGVAVAVGQNSRNEVSAGTNSLPVANSLVSLANAPLASNNDTNVPAPVTAASEEANAADSPALFLPPRQARQGQMLTTPSSGSSQPEEGEQGTPAPMADPAIGEGATSEAESYPLQRGELVLDPSPDLSSPFDLGVIDKALAIDSGTEASSVPWWVWPMLGSVAGAVWLTRRRQQEEEYQAREEQALRELLV